MGVLPSTQYWSPERQAMAHFIDWFRRAWLSWISDGQIEIVSALMANYLCDLLYRNSRLDSHEVSILPSGNSGERFDHRLCCWCEQHRALLIRYPDVWH